MARPVTLFTGQWTDLPLEDVARKASEFGYQGLELACGGDHFEIDKALSDDGYCANRRDLLERFDLQVYAISNHAVGQAVLDRVDERHKAILPAQIWGDGKPGGVAARASEEMKNTAKAAQKLGVEVVNGFTGSSIWHLVGGYPTAPAKMIDDGYRLLADRWNPILDVFGECGVRFALEVHPGEIAFDLVTAQRTLESLEHREDFGFNFDPSHLLWQGIDPVEFIRAFPDRIFHVHVKDAVVTLNGRNGILSSYLPLGDPRRGWECRSPGRGSINFEEIIRALNQIKYEGPLSVEFQDPAMDREFGAAEARDFIQKIDFAPAGAPSEAALAEQE